MRIDVEGLKETDEVIELRRLNYDTNRKELFFAIFLRK